MNLIEHASLFRAATAAPHAGGSLTPVPHDAALSCEPARSAERTSPDALPHRPSLAGNPELDFFDPGMRSVPIVIDIERLRQTGYVVPGDSRTPIAREFAQVKRPLLTNARDVDSIEKRQSLIMVTSSLPREGKTFCAINLAISMSFEIDVAVLLVDADVLRPSILDRLGVAPARGLLDLLVDSRLAPSDVILRTNIPKLSILPAGLPNDLSSELLASDAMEMLLRSLATSYADHVIVFDTPPLLVTTEAKVLAARMGQVLLVVAASSTPIGLVKEAFTTLDECPVVLSLLNKAPPSAIPLYDGY